MPLGMARVGLSGQFEFVNQALCRMLGYTSEELVAVGEVPLVITTPPGL